MAKFKITTDDGTFVVNADTAETAMEILDQHSANEYTGPADKNGVPEGMVLDPATNRMVDTKALANHEIPGGSWPATALKGLPFLGSYVDEAAGYLTSSSDTKNHPNESQQIQTDIVRQSQKKFEDENPKTALASKLAVGASTLPLALAATPEMAGMGLLGRTAVGLGLGATTGGVEGAVSGFGEGEGDQRFKNAGDQAMWGAATGGVLGAAAPALSDAVSAGARNLLDRFTVNRQLDQIGLSRPAADAMQTALQADDALGRTGRRNILRAGPDGMLADAGPAASALVDVAVQKSGPAGAIARRAVLQRANAAGQRLRGTMDLVLGRPPGIDQAARDVAARTAAARQQAYDLTYRQPIDYASPAGRAIEDVFNRTPPSILRNAITRANERMVILRQPNQQIRANIADDGTITFHEMPNMRQVDELKKALQHEARATGNVDEFGRMNARGHDVDGLARDLRDAARDAVPEYRRALNLGGDKIGEDDALRLGTELLNPSTTRESVHDFVDGMTDEQRRQVALGLRQSIDEKMANVTQVISDPNLDAREASAILKDMSSKAAREKITAVFGAQRARPLFRQLDQARAALELKSNVATNSKTFARTDINRAVEDRNKDSALMAIRKGEPLQASKRVIQSLTGADANSLQNQTDAVWQDISRLMTGARGPDAQAALQRLTAAYRAGTLNQQTAHQVGRILSGGVLLPSYQLATQTAEK